MPIFEIVSNDGKKYRVDADNEDAALSAFHPQSDKYQDWAQKSVANEQNASSYLPDVMQGSQRKILQGLTGNFADDALAYGNAFIDPLLGRGRGLDFEERLKYEKARQAELNRVADEKSGVAGDVAGGLASALGISRIGRAGGTLLRAGQSLPAQIAAGGAEGAGYGAIYGAGEGDGLPDKASKAISGGLGGGVFGAALPGVFAAGKYAAAKPISNLIASRDPEGFAAAKYGSAMLDAGTTPQAVMRQVNDANAAGVPLNIADAIGKPGQRLLYTAASAEGPGRNLTTEALNRRQSGMAGRVGNLVEEALGVNSTARQSEEALNQQARQNSRPLYAAIPEYPTSITPRVEQFLQEPLMQDALRNGIQIQRNNALAAGEDLAGYTLPEASRANNAGLNSFNFRNYQAMKIGLDDMLEKYRNPMTGRLELDDNGISIQNLRRSLDEDLKQMFPGYAEADAAYAGPASIRSAIGTGQQMARGGRFDDNLNTYNRMNEGQQAGARIGYADRKMQSLEKANISGNRSANPAANLMNEKDLQELNRMSQFQGPTRQGAPTFDNNEITRRLNWEDQMAQTRQQALMGSRTAENLADQQTGGVDSRLSGALRSFIAGDWRNGAGQLAGSAFNGVGNLYGGNNAAVREQLARIGLSTGDTNLAAMLRRATAQGRRAKRKEMQIMQGLLGAGASRIGSMQ